MASNIVAVWGATGSIGLAIVKAFLCRSWWVVAFGRSVSSEQYLARVGSNDGMLTVERLRYRKIPNIGRASISGLIESCGMPWSLPRVYINAAGLCFYGPFSSTSHRDFDLMVKSNLGVSFNILKHLHLVAHHAPSEPFLYVEIGSRAGANVDHANFSLYAMAKQGQIGLLRSLAAEMEGTQCSFLVLSPRGVKTKLYERSLGDQQMLRQKFENSTDLLPAALVAETLVEDIERWNASEHHSTASNFEHKII